MVSDSDPRLYFPPHNAAATWETTDPSATGWDTDALAAFLDFCEREKSTHVLVLERGRIVAESTFRGASITDISDIASAQKSVIALVLAQLVAAGTIDIDAPLSNWLGADWTKAGVGHEHEVLVRHAITMTTGLYDDFAREAPPGTIWYYNNNAYHQLRKAIEIATGKSTQEVCRELVFDPIGMTQSEWLERPQMIDPAGWTLSGLVTTARDLARFGLAILASGSWDGTNLGVEHDFFDALFVPSTELNSSYGYLWWLLGQERAIVPGPPKDGKVDPRKLFGGREVPHALAASAPPDTVAAMGFGNNRLYVTPSRDLVVVRLGRATDGAAAASSFDEALWRQLSAAMPKVSSIP